MERIPTMFVVVLLLFVHLAMAQSVLPNFGKADTVELHYPHIHGFEQLVNINIQPNSTYVIPHLREGWIPQLVVINHSGHRNLEDGKFIQSAWHFNIPASTDSLQRILWRYQLEDLTESSDCQVDIACPEGLPYKNIGASVFRLAAFVDGFIFYGSGVLINNTAEDQRPLLLTAEHNGLDFFYTRFATQAELDHWIFEFDVDRDKCNNFSFIRGIKRYFGATLLARSSDGGGQTGTDFALLELNDNRFAGDEHAFAGWSRDTTAPQNGVTVHHPRGGVKKISFFNSPAQPGTFSAQPTPMHWEVSWTATANGHGVTETGSSGSPLFDQNNAVVGTLTGGSSSCTQLFENDYYAMFSLQWDQTGPDSTEQLAPWLDPLQTGQLTLSGQILNADTYLTSFSQDIYPNPIEMGKTLRLKGFPTTTMYLYNAAGQLIDSYGIEKNTIFEMPAPQQCGLYIIKYESNRHIHTKKLIVQ